MGFCLLIAMVVAGVLFVGKIFGVLFVLLRLLLGFYLLKNFWGYVCCLSIGLVLILWNLLRPIKASLLVPWCLCGGSFCYEQKGYVHSPRVYQFGLQRFVQLCSVLAFVLCFGVMCFKWASVLSFFRVLFRSLLYGL